MSDASPQSPSGYANGQLNLRLSSASKPQNTKKISIKLSSSGPKTTTQSWEEDKWKKLQSAVRAIHRLESTPYTKEELYSDVEDFVIHKLGANLYKKLQDELDAHLKKEAMRIKQEKLPTHEAFLAFLNNVWTNHCNHMLLIRSIFLSLDRKYALQTSNVRALWDLGLMLFRSNVATVPEIQRRTLASLLHFVERDRMGDTIDKALFKNIIRMYMALQLYTDVFEKPFVDASEQFFANEAKTLINTLDIAQYLVRVEERLEQEVHRVVNFLDSSTRRPLITAMERVLLAVHVDTIINKGLEQLLDEGRNGDLKRMYNLFARLGTLSNVERIKAEERDRIPLWRLKTAWNMYIKKRGEALIMDKEKDAQMVQELMNFKAKLDETLSVAFEQQDQFAYALKEGFEHFINKRTQPPTPAELVAKFLHKRLQSGSKITSDVELDQLLDKVMQIFRFINGKDVFEAFYKKDLAKRLLMGKYASIDAEKAMISRLKTECGAQFTSKLEAMFKDMELSKELTAEFKQSQNMKSDCNIFVLTTGQWPPYTTFEVKLPVELAAFQDSFQQFYLRKFHGRRLSWVSTLGTCILRANFPKGRKELSVSFLQATVLMLFNESDQLSYTDIKNLTGMADEGELKRTLQSLAMGKFKVIVKDNAATSKEIAPEDTFSFNKNFTAKLFRLKINQIQLKETKEEQTKTQETVFQDRIYQVDAAIVRIMKTRKTLTHQLLLSELFQQLKFPCKPADLKKRIETLIERDYLERDKDDPNIYKYKA